MSENETIEPEFDQLLTPDEICAWFKISKDLLYDLVQQRRIPFLRVGGRQLRFRRSEMEAYLAERHNDGGQR